VLSRSGLVEQNREMALALFDLDNTLVDRTVAFARAIPRLAEHYGLDQAEVVPFMIETDQDGGVGWEVWMALTIERFDIETTADEMIATFRPLYLDCYQVQPEVVDGLLRLKDRGWRIGVVTNGPPSQNEKVTGTGLDQLVHGWVVSEEAGVRKPDRQIFELAASRCRASLQGGWMVGDSAPADMVGARNAGLRSVWLHRGREWGEVGHLSDPYELAHGLPSTRSSERFEPDHQVDHPLEAIELILASG
jgi:putative hydrolase of the HAD superfamily